MKKIDLQTPATFEKWFCQKPAWFFLDYVDENEQSELLVYRDRYSMTSVEFSRQNYGDGFKQDWTMAVWFGPDLEHVTKLPIRNFKKLDEFLDYVQSKEAINSARPSKPRI